MSIKNKSRWFIFCLLFLIISIGAFSTSAQTNITQTNLSSNISSNQIASLWNQLKYIQSLLSSFISSQPSQTQLAQVAPTSGLVGYWSFDGNANDSSGNGNNGTLVNVPTFTAGKLGQALSFDGSSNYIDIGTQSGLSLNTKHSVSAWVKTNVINVSQAIFSHGGAACCGSEYGLWIRYDGGAGTYKFHAVNNLNSSYIKSVPPLWMVRFSREWAIV